MSSPFAGVSVASLATPDDISSVPAAPVDFGIAAALAAATKRANVASETIVLRIPIPPSASRVGRARPALDPVARDDYFGLGIGPGFERLEARGKDRKTEIDGCFATFGRFPRAQRGC